MLTAPAGLVWLASFPKSGNTWLRILLANLMHSLQGNKAPADINALPISDGIASSRNHFEWITQIDSGLLDHDECDRLRPRVYEALAAEADAPVLMKVHDAYTMTLDGEPLLAGRAARAAVYIVRDPRDIAISAAHHFSLSLDDTITMLNAPDSELQGSTKGQPRQLRQKLLGWSGHAASWLQQTDVPVHLLRYEDLLGAPIEQFSRVLDFLQITASADHIERAVYWSSFDELQRQERSNGFREAGRQAFFRKGQTGGWKDVLSSQQIESLEHTHAVWMARLGYQPSRTPDPARPQEPEGEQCPPC